MKKCLTPEERKEKQVAIKYLYRELYGASRMFGLQARQPLQCIPDNH